jgi:TIGR03009 family protein
MTRREMLKSCLPVCLSGSLMLAGGLLSAQQPRPSAGRATVNPRRSSAPPAQTGAQQQTGQDPRVERPPPGNMETPLPKELEDLLVKWEENSGKIERLRGDFDRYVYDMVYLAEQRAVGMFYYLAPDQGRMDFGPVPNDKVPPRIDKAKGRFSLQSQPKQRWICNGKDIYIIDDDQKLYDVIHIPLQQQGRNIINGPLPFLFGMKAQQAKARYNLSLGDKHSPQGQVVTGANGKPVRLAPQLHIVAIPQLPVDRTEWQRADVLLTKDFLPRAIRLINATGTKETSYVFYPEPVIGEDKKMLVNERFWLKNPFNDGPPANYTKGEENRASDEETSVRTDRVLPAAGQKRAR